MGHIELVGIGFASGRPVRITEQNIKFDHEKVGRLQLFDSSIRRHDNLVRRAALDDTLGLDILH